LQRSVITKQDEIIQVQKEIEDIKSGLRQEGGWLRELYSSKSPKKDALIHWANCIEKLHELGVYKEPLNTISSSIQKELRTMGLGEAVVYVHEVLPFKYKDQSYNHSKQSDEREVEPHKYSSNSDNIQYIEANKLALQDVRKDIEILKQFEKKLEESDYISKLDLQEFKEFLLAKEMGRQRLQDVLDGREKVMYSTQHIFFHYFSGANTDYIFANYVKHIKDFADFTSKQALKILRGRVSRLLPLYEPKNRVEAINAGFYGIPCDECGSYRVDKIVQVDPDSRKPVDVLYCFAKGHKNKVKTARLPKR